MAVNVPALESLLPVPGVMLGTAHANIKGATVGALGVPDDGLAGDPAEKEAVRHDLAVMLFASGTEVAGVYTQNQFRAAPVQLCQALADSSSVRAFLINSGNANAATGEAGLSDARALQSSLSTLLGGGDVMPFSTGVIGERLPLDAMRRALAGCVATASETGWEAAAGAIMTTDTVPKAVSQQAQIDGVTVTATGMAKGAGMIQPNMATLLSYVCCDAQVPKNVLQQLCQEVADASFNRISVDGDTSTNDCFMLVATAQAEVSVGQPSGGEYEQLKALLVNVAAELAQRIVRDAEGATKFVTVQVRGGARDTDCLQVAYTVAHSPLVKTALFASDPNWGRICMAMGRAGVPFEQQAVSVHFNRLPVVAAGVVAPTYTEAAGAKELAADELLLQMSIGEGPGQAQVWTSDLSYDYVRINAEYRS